MVDSSWDRLAPRWLRSVGSAVDTTTTSSAAMNAPAEASASVQFRRIGPGWPGRAGPAWWAGRVGAECLGHVWDASVAGVAYWGSELKPSAVSRYASWSWPGSVISSVMARPTCSAVSVGPAVAR